MRIAFDHQIFGWQEYGGISRYAYELAVELATTWEQDVAIIAPLYVNRYLPDAPAKLRVIGVPVPRIPKTGRIYRAINSFFAWPALSHFNPDIVHETYYSFRRIAPRRARVILTVHDMIHEKFSEYFSVRDPTSQEKASAVKRADHVICISERTRQDLIELFGVDPARTSVVYHGFTLSNQAESGMRTASFERPFLLYVGNRGGYKNFKGLLRAYAASNRIKNNFDLICFGGGEFTTDEKNDFQQLGLSAKNVHHASGGDEILAGYYRGASAFIYPSLYEGFGISPLEAMSFDCPVVCSGVSSIPEVVGNAGEMFDPYDPDSIRTAIERVVGDDAVRQILINRGKERLKLFSWKRCAQETLGIYRRVLS
jgi:glycosyltransferase involved in cell wall biosynthesis